jgi:phosphatidylglycerol:prolipoprotein diacylglycerol transferase
VFTTVGPVTLPTFTLYVSLAIVVSGGIAILYVGRSSTYRAVADVCLIGLVGGFLLARIEYVALNWEVFAATPVELFDMRTGGLDWHGALIGALCGVWIGARWRKLDLPTLLGALSPALSLIAFAGWTACRRIGCAYGIEVETLAFYPGWTVTEGRDIYGLIAPRYDTHHYGQVLAWGLLLIVGLAWWRWRPSAALFWGMVAIFGLGMFVIGFWRGDIAPIGWRMRADQWLDLGVALLATVMLWRSRHPPGESTH